MSFFDDYDILGGLADLVTAPLKMADKALFGDEGEVGGLLGTPIQAVLDNPDEVLTTAAAIVATAGTAALAVGTGGVSGLVGVAGRVGSITATRAVGAALAGSSTGYARSAIAPAVRISAAQAASYGVAGFVAREAAAHVVDNYVRETVTPVEGSIVYCDLAGIIEHSGIYVGGGRIVHLDGSGAIQLVTYDEFMRRLGGANPSLSIYVACRGTVPVGDAGSAARARDMVGSCRSYSILLDNCHQFTSGCITGDFENSDNFWYLTKGAAERRYGIDNWRVWRNPA